MFNLTFSLAALLCLLPGSLQAADAPSGDTAAHNWPNWRGPLGTGAAPHGKPPSSWSETKNVRWKLAIPGHGHSTPVIWGDHIFLTTAVPYGDPVVPKPDTAPGAHDNLPVTHHHGFVVLAISRKSGKILWQRTVRKQLPREGGHETGSLASNSPVTDGQRVYAFFGSRGLYCLDFEGNILWKEDLGRMETRHAHGEGSSPVLAGDVLVVNWDHQDQSFVVAFDKRTGKQLWKVLRDEITSWSSPFVLEHEGKLQVVISATGRVRSYDPQTGKVIWECGGMSRNVVASPVGGDGMLYAGSSYETQKMVAIRLDGAQGDVTGSDQIVWSTQRLTPYVPSPLLYGETLYFLRHNQSILTRLVAKTGENDGGPFRLGPIGNIFASPVGADGRIYITDRTGVTLVLKHSAVPQLISVNRLDDGFSASPAIVGNELFLRGQESLYCIVETQ
ncbi:MAG: hypothetical protein CMJ48_03390 [Planctomycetaceae bacterium]|nr:hypothetical protein [Planctomycetaceae bacterium]